MNSILAIPEKQEMEKYFKSFDFVNVNVSGEPDEGFWAKLTFENGKTVLIKGFTKEIITGLADAWVKEIGGKYPFAINCLADKKIIALAANIKFKEFYKNTPVNFSDKRIFDPKFNNLDVLFDVPGCGKNLMPKISADGNKYYFCLMNEELSIRETQSLAAELCQ